MADEQNGWPEIAPKPTPGGVDASPVERFASIFPWMRSRSLADQEACANDLASAASPELLAAELTSWRETAAAVVVGLGNIEVDRRQGRITKVPSMYDDSPRRTYAIGCVFSS